MEESRSGAEAEKAGQADHSLSDINPVVVCYLRPTLTGHISGSSDCWKENTERDRKDKLVSILSLRVQVVH